MSYSHVTAENDIRARTLALAEALVASNPNAERLLKLREKLRGEMAASVLPPDAMTWFAIERVAVGSGLPAVRLEQQGTPIPAGAIVLISPLMEPPATSDASTVQALRAASFVVAPAAWGPVLRGARLNAFSIDTSETPPGPVPPARRPFQP